MRGTTTYTLAIIVLVDQFIIILHVILQYVHVLILESLVLVQCMMRYVVYGHVGEQNFALLVCLPCTVVHCCMVAYTLTRRYATTDQVQCN